MADLDRFFDWFTKAFVDRYSFEEEADHTFQTVVDNTGGWAASGKLRVLDFALYCMEGDEQYLEIGSYCGRSIVGALVNNDKRAQVIDPFELFLPDGLGIFAAWTTAVESHGVADRITLHKALCQDFDGELPPIGVCYFDGNHDSGHTYEAMKKFESRLADRAIVICDDYMIFGGGAQTPYPGHPVVIQNPVQADVDRWVAETPEATFVELLPWEHKSALIRYERN